jgi:hypothetical protein
MPTAKKTTEFNPSKIKVETGVELPKQQRTSKYGDNPFTDHVRESFQTQTGRRVVVPGPLTEKRSVKNPQTGKTTTKVTDGPAVRKVKYLLNQAASHQNLGVRIVVEEQDNGQVAVMFQGKKRKGSDKDAA